MKITHDVLRDFVTDVPVPFCFSEIYVEQVREMKASILGHLDKMLTQWYSDLDSELIPFHKMPWDKNVLNQLTNINNLIIDAMAENYCVDMTIEDLEVFVRNILADLDSHAEDDRKLLIDEVGRIQSILVDLQTDKSLYLLWGKKDVVINHNCFPVSGQEIQKIRIKLGTLLESSRIQFRIADLMDMISSVSVPVYSTPEYRNSVLDVKKVLCSIVSDLQEQEAVWLDICPTSKSAEFSFIRNVRYEVNSAYKNGSFDDKRTRLFVCKSELYWLKETLSLVKCLVSISR
ncbi:MAG: hypothetical protein M0Z78_08910 [Betaproteobacteria bacterium]|nr:hypothetical protein [Betaproteobacteria bacterium]